MNEVATSRRWFVRNLNDRLEVHLTRRDCRAPMSALVAPGPFLELGDRHRSTTLMTLLHHEDRTRFDHASTALASYAQIITSPREFIDRA